MYETKDDIPEYIWDYVESFFENELTKREEPCTQQTENSAMTK